MTDAVSVLSELLERPVAYHPVLAKALSSVPAAVILSQGIYWQKRTPPDKDGWFWVTGDEWYNQTGVSEESQLTARRILKQTGFWEEKLIGLPAKMHYRINIETLVAVISGYLKTGLPVTVDNRRKKPDNARASSGKFRQLVDGESGDKKNTIENLEDNTDETKASAAVAPGTGPAVELIEIPVVEDGKNGAASKGAGPQTKSWSARAMIMFDEVNEGNCKADRIDYIAFDWNVCKDENFGQLKNIRTAIESGFSKKSGHAPTETELLDCFQLIFHRSWHYFRKIQKDKGGALHYTPTSIYTNFNRIKTFKNGNINGITTENGSAGTAFQSGVNHNGEFDPTRGY